MFHTTSVTVVVVVLVVVVAVVVGVVVVESEPSLEHLICEARLLILHELFRPPGGLRLNCTVKPASTLHYAIL
jgi:hypothetical protein